MRPTLPLLQATDFPGIKRHSLETLQVNLGYKCNQSCLHCHVNAGPNRKEMMTGDTIAQIIDVLSHCRPQTLDLTGGAPELNEYFRHLVRQARTLGITVIDRCNLTILNEPGQEDLARFLAEQSVQVTASLPCYSPANVDRQRGDGVFERSIAALKMLNALGYGKAGSGLILNLVFNPQGPSLPPPQDALERDYKRELKDHFGIEFNHLFTITNMPIQRFGSTLVSKGNFRQYMTLLKSAYRPENLETVMCRSTISVDWQGNLYDCDFNQMLGLDLKLASPTDEAIKKHGHIRDLLTQRTDGLPILIADHCYGCTAGQGSSCTGALDSSMTSTDTPGELSVEPIENKAAQ